MKKQDSVGNVLTVSILLISTFIKSLVFYGQLNLKRYALPFAFATCGILLFVYLVAFFLTSPKVAKRLLAILYGAGGFLMAVDGVYYAYVSKLPSVAQIGMAWQIGDVLSTVKTLINWRRLLPVFDFPLWFLYRVNRKKVNSAPRKISGKPILIGGLSLCAVCLSVVLFCEDFKPRYMINELYCYHVYDLARTLKNSLSAREVDKTLYVVSADTDDENYGVAKNRNLIVVQVEALQNFVIGAEYNGQTITPNLNALIGEDSFYFSNYYYQIGGGNTCDAEFAVNNSLFGPENEAGYVKYANNDYNGLPWLLKQNGYSGAYAFHGYYGYFWNREEAYVKQGFDDFKSLEDYAQTETFAMGISDRELFTEAMDSLKSYEEPFYSFFITVSSHHPYVIPENEREIALSPEDEGTLFGQYLQAVNYVDRVLGEFVEMLKEAGLYDNSVIVVYGDHYALTNTDYQISAQVSALTGKSYTIFDVFNVPLLIHIPGMGNAEIIETAGGHVDVMPTVLHLLGIENNKTVTFGQNLLTAERGLVCEQTHVAVGSFISDELFFMKPYNNIEENYSVYRKGTMETLRPTAFEALSDYVYNRVKDCETLLERNDIFLDDSPE